ncbi:DUF1416 domain-containing protein [Actinokineospora globicatena]|uniref:DUF1416 domain-containing protein n=1 Tax=Actinokineospora globicatena TaxID=103729 RepID=A0A9W6QPM9_9PSEU|nr:DUF1416 domain-containing protein [Actinokineospora globicatena]MCP2301518.1 Protein of unknown function (DUF1416) [Actinokineospora globicatena]GLW76835.1 hypothetical protein Aglo01_13170 [Actinokineospora globicatena]GLW83668.1 hypothetical protein Aglo02_13080 [Actinokineospora globicatena]GLW92384.1 hypothetical protein Aglo03_32000 [Actinokineospora globicatena]
MSSCGAPEQGTALPANVDAGKEVVLNGKVTSGETPVGGAYVRLLDASGEFTAEVVSSADGDFRFFAAPGEWTVRALHRSGNGEAKVSAEGPGLHQVAVSVG